MSIDPNTATGTFTNLQGGDWRSSFVDERARIESTVGAAVEPMTKKHKSHFTPSQSNESGACDATSFAGAFNMPSDMSREASLRAIQLIRMQNAHGRQRDMLSSNSNHATSSTVDQREREQERKRIFSTLVAAAASVSPATWSAAAASCSGDRNRVQNQAYMASNDQGAVKQKAPQFSGSFMQQHQQGNYHGSGHSASPQMVLYSKMQEVRRFQQQQRRLEQQHAAAEMVRHGGMTHNGGSPNFMSSQGMYNMAAAGNFMYQVPSPTMGAMNSPQGPDTGMPLCLPVILARRGDALKVSSLQVLLRHQIEAFQATEDDVTTHTRGRNKAVKLGQVGIRCRHCAHLPVLRRQKGSTYFPATTLGLYQASQNMNSTHMQNGLCSEMPLTTKVQFAHLMATKVSSAGAGRPYWAATAKELGLVDTEEGIYFVRDLPPGAKLLEEKKEK